MSTAYGVLLCCPCILWHSHVDVSTPLNSIRRHRPHRPPRWTHLPQALDMHPSYSTCTLLIRRGFDSITNFWRLMQPSCRYGCNCSNRWRCCRARCLHLGRCWCWRYQPCTPLPVLRPSVVCLAVSDCSAALRYISRGNIRLHLSLALRLKPALRCPPAVSGSLLCFGSVEHSRDIGVNLLRIPRSWSCRHRLLGCAAVVCSTMRSPGRRSRSA